MTPIEPEEEKRKDLIDELLQRHEPLIARAVESAPDCRLRNGNLFLNYNYQDSVHAAWAKVLTDFKLKPRLLAAAKQVGIEVHVLS
jgi:hypothetical protein